MDNLFSKDIIDRGSAVPMYFQLYTYIEKLIEDNILKNGERLPTENEMMELLGISRPTIRQAYKELSSKGYVVRQRSKGTVVKKTKIYDKFLNTLVSFRNELEMRGEEVRTKVLDFKVIDECGEPVKILGTNEVIYLRRVRYSNDVPILYTETYLVKDMFMELLDYNLETDSLYSHMSELGHAVVSVQRIIGAEPADPETAKWLNMKPKEPVLISKTTGYTEDGIPVEYTYDNYNGMASNFKISLDINPIK